MSEKGHSCPRAPSVLGTPRGWPWGPRPMLKMTFLTNGESHQALCFRVGSWGRTRDTFPPMCLLLVSSHHTVLKGCVRAFRGSSSSSSLRPASGHPSPPHRAAAHSLPISRAVAQGHEMEGRASFRNTPATGMICLQMPFSKFTQTSRLSRARSCCPVQSWAGGCGLTALPWKTLKTKVGRRFIFLGCKILVEFQSLKYGANTSLSLSF